MQETLNRKLRNHLTQGAGLILPSAASVASAMTARLIEAAGHPLPIVSGAAVANTFCGVPDIGLASITELALPVAAVRDRDRAQDLCWSPARALYDIRALTLTG